jgi:hypothetical protein
MGIPVAYNAVGGYDAIKATLDLSVINDKCDLVPNTKLIQVPLFLFGLLE